MVNNWFYGIVIIIKQGGAYNNYPFRYNVLKPILKLIEKGSMPFLFMT